MALLNRGALGVLAAATVALALCPPVELAAQRSLEYEVKAAFLYNFIQFVEWPAESLRVEPFRICLAGQNPFGDVLERTVAGEQAAGRPVQVEVLAPDASPAGCQILFVPRSQAPRAVALLRTVGATPVLTVGESPRFLEAGGIVNFVVESGHVRFDVSADTAAARGLRISSKLLRVARATGTPDRRDQ